MVRTPGFHPGNRGPIPRGAAKKKSHHLVGFFLLGILNLSLLDSFQKRIAKKDHQHRVHGKVEINFIID